jgi:hypothetical protein
MINFTTNQRRSVRWTGSDWVEEVLAASGVEADDSTFTIVSGNNVQELLERVDNELAGIDYSVASGIVMIDDVSNVSGTVGDTLGNLDVINLGDADDSVFRFSFTVPAQPAADVQIRVMYAPRANGPANIKLDLDYDIFEQGDDPSGGTLALSKTETLSVGAAAQDEIALCNFILPTTEFTAAGAAPYIVTCQITRDVSVASNLADDVSITNIFADNVPGGIIGNQAGYIGGNLTVTGDLTVEGLTVLEGGAVPASGTGTGISGSLVLDDDFIYVAVATNLWKRTAIKKF